LLDLSNFRVLVNYRIADKNQGLKAIHILQLLVQLRYLVVACNNLPQIRKVLNPLEAYEFIV
jgi:hypothetical protein